MISTQYLPGFSLEVAVPSERPEPSTQATTRKASRIETQATRLCDSHVLARQD